MNALPSHVDLIQGSKPGPNVVVMGAVHGDERLGADVITTLTNEINPAQLHGCLTLILGNPAAYALNQRFVDQDLNRLFGAESKNNGFTAEEKRALEIIPFLNEADYLLDIHGTIKPSVPFVYCEATPEHLRLARLFELDYIVSPAAGEHLVDLNFSTDNYVDAHGGIGLTYEAGWHKQPSALADVVKKTYAFLSVVGSLSLPVSTPIKEPVQVEIYETLLPSDKSFKFEKNFSNFDAYGDALIIFPKLDILPGKPAGYLGRIKTS